MQIAIIVVILVFSTAFASKEGYHSASTEDFNSIERFLTLSLNGLPGFGSIAVMNDWTGAITQWVLYGGGITLMIVGVYQDEEKCKTYTLIEDSNTIVERCYFRMTKAGDNIVTTGLMMLVSGYVFNIYRSITYKKPGSVAYNKYGNFNVAVAPNRHGNISTHFMYNKAF